MFYIELTYRTMHCVQARYNAITMR